MSKTIIQDKSIKLWESNTLAIAPINRILELNSLKLFLWSMYHAVEQKKTNLLGGLEAEFSLKEFANYFGIDLRNTYSFAKKWASKIGEYQYYLYDDKDDKFKQRTAIPSVDYDKGILKTVFNEALTKNLLELKENKIFIELKHLKKIKNPRFVKLYEYLKAKAYAGQINRVVNISLANLYKLFVVMDGNYPSFANFKQRILIPVINEFNKIDDIKIEKWEPVKTGRAVSSIKFWVSNHSNKLLTKDEKSGLGLKKKIKCQRCFQGYYKIRENTDYHTNNNNRFFYGCSKYPECKKVISIKQHDEIVESKNHV